MKEQAEKIDDAYWRAITNVPDIYTKGRVRFAAGLREIINQLQRSPGVIMCADVLELCDELEAL
jgi:hypothetical protein